MRKWSSEDHANVLESLVDQSLDEDEQQLLTSSGRDESSRATTTMKKKLANVYKTIYSSFHILR